MRKNSRKKFGLLMGISLGAIATSSCALLFSHFSNFSNEISQKHTIKFILDDKDKEDGASLSGNTTISFKNETSLNEISVPVAKKTVMKNGNAVDLPFVDWIDEDGNVVNANSIIKSQSKQRVLRATFSDYWTKQGVRLVTVNFMNPDREDSFAGITTLSVPIGRSLGTINKPRIKHKAGVEKVFKGWAIKGRSGYLVMQQSWKIEENVTLVPMFETLVKFTFDFNGGSKTHGVTEIQTYAGTKFGDINQPTGKGVNDAIFEGWYKDSGLNDKWLPDYQIYDDAKTAYAKWVEIQPGQNQYSVNFISNLTSGQPTTQYSGNTTIISTKETSWYSVNKPTVTCDNYKVDYWEYSDDYDPLNPEATSHWNKLTDESTYAGSKANIYVRPVMAIDVSEVHVVGPTTAPKGLSTPYDAYVSPSKEGQQVEWSLLNETGSELSREIAHIDENGVLYAETDTESYSGPIKIKVKATSRLDSTKFDTLDVILDAPYENSADFWTYTAPDPSAPSEYKWCKLRNLCDKDSDIFLEDYSSNGASIARSEFNVPIYVGSKISIIPSEFLYGCSSFDSEIAFNNVVTIDNDFMTNCSTFNKKLDLSKVQNILNNFMVQCTSFNNGNDTGIAATAVALDMTAIKKIGDNFLSGCGSYNSPISWNNTEDGIKKIGDNFLFECSSYSQKLTFPASLTYVGKGCMHNCHNFISQLVVNVPSTVFQGVDTESYHYDFCSESKETKIYNPGFTVNGTQSADFMSKFPNIDVEESETHPAAYRTNEKREEPKPFDQTSWEYIIKACNRFDASDQTDADVLEFCDNFTSIPFNPEGQTAEEQLANFVDIEKDLKMTVTTPGGGTKEVILKCRVIGAAHDELADGSGKKAALTFECDEVATDFESDETLRTKYDNTNNRDFPNSQLLKNLNSENSSDIYWYKKDGEQKSSVNNSCYKMMLTGDPLVANNIKTVKKHVCTGNSLTLTEYQTKLFILTSKEFGFYPNDQWTYKFEEGETYQKYKIYTQNTAAGKEARANRPTKKDKLGADRSMALATPAQDSSKRTVYHKSMKYHEDGVTTGYSVCFAFCI